MAKVQNIRNHAFFPLKKNRGSLWTLFKYINRQNNNGRSQFYMDILITRTLYMSCQVGRGSNADPSALKASADNNILAS